MTFPIQFPPLPPSVPVSANPPAAGHPRISPGGKVVVQILKTGPLPSGSMRETLKAVESALDSQGFTALPPTYKNDMAALKKKVVEHIKDPQQNPKWFDKFPIFNRVARFFYNLIASLLINEDFEKVNNKIKEAEQTHLISHLDSATQKLTVLKIKAEAIASKCQGATRYGSQNYKDLSWSLKTTSDNISAWCQANLTNMKDQKSQIGTSGPSDLLKVEADIKQVETDIQKFEHVLEEAGQSQNILASIGRYATDLAKTKLMHENALFPKNFRNRGEVLNLFRQAARANRPPDELAVRFVQKMFSKIYTCEMSFEAQRQKITTFCAQYNLPQERQRAMLDEVKRLAQTFLDTDQWPPNRTLLETDPTTDLTLIMRQILAVNSPETQAYLDAKIAEFNQNVTQLLQRELMTPEVQIHHLKQEAQRHGLHSAVTALEAKGYMPVLKNEADFYRQLSRENGYQLILPLSPGDAFAQKYNEAAKNALGGDLSSLNLKQDKALYHPDPRQYLRNIAQANNYATIPTPSTVHASVEALRVLYNQTAGTERATWLNQNPAFAALPRIQKITKKNFIKILPYRTNPRPLGTGSSKVAFQVQVEKPNNPALKKIKVLAAVNLTPLPLSARPAKIQLVNQEISEEYRLSQLFRARNVPNLALVRAVQSSADGAITYAYMDFCDGGQLDDFCAKTPALSNRDKITMAIELSQALAGIHAAGYFHGDMKTFNVLVQTRREIDGSVHPHAKLSDFGRTRKIGEIGVEGVTQGTCIPPENLNDYRTGKQQKGTAESDLWILADLLYTLHRGRSLFFNDCIKIIGAPPTGGALFQPASYPNFPLVHGYIENQCRTWLQSTNDPIDALIAQLLDANPGNRPTAAAVVARLQAYLATLP